MDEYFHMVEQDKVYFLSNAKVDFAKKQFSNVKNEYELILQRDSQLIPVSETPNRPPWTFFVANKPEISTD